MGFSMHVFNVEQNKIS